MLSQNDMGCEEDEVFWGPVTEKELRIALPLANRPTITVDDLEKSFIEVLEISDDSLQEENDRQVNSSPELNSEEKLNCTSKTFVERNAENISSAKECSDINTIVLLDDSCVFSENSEIENVASKAGSHIRIQKVSDFNENFSDTTYTILNDTTVQDDGFNESLSRDSLTVKGCSKVKHSFSSDSLHDKSESLNLHYSGDSEESVRVSEVGMSSSSSNACEDEVFWNSIKEAESTIKNFSKRSNITEDNTGDTGKYFDTFDDSCQEIHQVVLVSSSGSNNTDEMCSDRYKNNISMESECDNVFVDDANSEESSSLETEGETSESSQNISETNKISSLRGSGDLTYSTSSYQTAQENWSEMAGSINDSYSSHNYVTLRKNISKVKNYSMEENFRYDGLNYSGDSLDSLGVAELEHSPSSSGSSEHHVILNANLNCIDNENLTRQNREIQTSFLQSPKDQENIEILNNKNLNCINANSIAAANQHPNSIQAPVQDEPCIKPSSIKKISKNKYKNVVSPVAQYIKDSPVPLVKNFWPESIISSGGIRLAKTLPKCKKEMRSCVKAKAQKQLFATPMVIRHK